MEILIHNLVRLRKNAGLSQEVLAERSSLNPAHLSQIETGRRWPKPATVESLARGLGVAPSELFRSDYLPPLRISPEECITVLSDFIRSQKERPR